MALLGGVRFDDVVLDKGLFLRLQLHLSFYDGLVDVKFFPVDNIVGYHRRVIVNFIGT